MKSQTLALSLGFVAIITLAWWIGHSAAGRADVAQARSVRQRSPALPVPKFSGGTPALPVEPEAASALMQRVLAGEPVTLSATQLEAYLTANHRNAESLLVASRLSGDLRLLREAVQRFPTDPRIQFELAMRSDDDAERQRATDAFAALDPDNALAGYLAAAQSLNLGDADGAVQRLMEASRRPAFRDYVMNGVQATEEALMSAGHSAAEAKAAAMFGAPLPFLSKLNELGRKMADLTRSYADTGDADSAAIMNTVGQSLGNQLLQAPARTLISELVGVSIETRFLSLLDPAAPVGSQGLTVQERLDQLAQRKASIRDLTRTVDPTSAALTPALLAQFIDRQKVLGEAAALQWLREKTGVKQPP